MSPTRLVNACCSLCQSAMGGSFLDAAAIVEQSVNLAPRIRRLSSCFPSLSLLSLYTPPVQETKSVKIKKDSKDPAGQVSSILSILSVCSIWTGRCTYRSSRSQAAGVLFLVQHDSLSASQNKNSSVNHRLAFA